MGVYDLVELGQPRLLVGDGAEHVFVTFRVMVFAPQKDQVMMGYLKESVKNKGIVICMSPPLQKDEHGVSKPVEPWFPLIRVLLEDFCGEGAPRWIEPEKGKGGTFSVTFEEEEPEDGGDKEIFEFAPNDKVLFKVKSVVYPPKTEPEAALMTSIMDGSLDVKKLSKHQPMIVYASIEDEGMGVVEWFFGGVV